MLTQSEFSRNKAVFFAPHADDEVLGAGGLIARLSRDGWEVHVVFGVISGFGSMSTADHSTTPDREEEAHAALSVLGCTSSEVLYRGEEFHLRLDCLGQGELISSIESTLMSRRPSLVVVPSVRDHHQDHRAIAEACVTALRPAPDGKRPFVPVVLAYGQSGAAGWGGEPYRFEPNFFVDITEQLDRKLEAMRCYTSQICDPPHGRSLEGIRSRANFYGALAGCQYAEAFESLRYVF